MTNFLEEGREEVISILGKNGKLKFEVAAALSFYGIILALWHFIFSAWRVEWPYRAAQLAFPLMMTLALGRSLESTGLKFGKLGEKIKLGLLVGIFLSLILALPLMKWVSPQMPESFSSSAEFGYAFLLIITNVVPMELFLRGYIQPRLELLTGSAPGLIMISILSGFDFWEAWVFNPAIVVGVALVLGLLYIRTRSIVTPITAHVAFLTLLMMIMVI